MLSLLISGYTALKGLIGSLLRRADVAYVLISALVIAVLWWLLRRSGDKVLELQGKLIQEKITKRLFKVNERFHSGKRDYDKAYQRYRDLHDAYTHTRGAKGKRKLPK